MKSFCSEKTYTISLSLSLSLSIELLSVFSCRFTSLHCSNLFWKHTQVFSIPLFLFCRHTFLLLCFFLSFRHAFWIAMFLFCCNDFQLFSFFFHASPQIKLVLFFQDLFAITLFSFFYSFWKSAVLKKEENKNMLWILSLVFG